MTPESYLELLDKIREAKQFHERAIEALQLVEGLLRLEQLKQNEGIVSKS